MTQDEQTTIDLRDRVTVSLGEPLAANAHAALWRCPVCPRESYSLLMVLADQHHCVGHYPCDGGASEWMRSLAAPSSDLVSVGKSA